MTGIQSTILGTPKGAVGPSGACLVIEQEALLSVWYLKLFLNCFKCSLQHNTRERIDAVRELPVQNPLIAWHGLHSSLDLGQDGDMDTSESSSAIVAGKIVTMIGGIAVQSVSITAEKNVCLNRWRAAASQCW